ncbi:MAG: hypothetical protein MR938_03315 [Tenericutes bacterium]|nr:hypothetical protein [Mycoplasmatota bacterium]
MKKVLLILITILLLTGCSSKNETTEEIITTKPVVDKKEKLTEAENILLNYGKLIYETEEWQNINLEIKTYETTLKEMNEVNGFDISAFNNYIKCDVDTTKIQYIVEGKEEGKLITRLNPVLDCK